MIDQIDNWFWFKLNGILREYIIRGGCRPFSNHFIINEYPKSGGSWVGQMVAEALELPFPRNRLPLCKSSIMHGHYYYPWLIDNVIIVWRDGRDVLVSQYYHFLFENNKYNKYLVNKVRKDLNFDDYNDIKNNLPKFIHYVYETKRHPRFSWSEFVDNWHDQNATFTKYENLRLDTAVELRRVIKAVSKIDIGQNLATEISERFSFQNQAGRKPGEERINNFMRKGIIGDWKNHFTQESKILFNQYAGKQLIMLGYETDENWINT